MGLYTLIFVFLFREIGVNSENIYLYDRFLKELDAKQVLIDQKVFEDLLHSVGKYVQFLNEKNLANKSLRALQVASQKESKQAK